ncbi:MAG: ABC transporter permease [Clostridia bacterium]|nr:ABC transporter permease [Clostridia bacterium]
MINYIIKRILSAIPTLLGVFLAVFFAIRLIPGDPAEVMLGANATDEQIEIYRESHGLNRSMGEQLLISLKGYVTGDLGTSVSYTRPVSEMIGMALPNTIELALIGVIISSVIAVALGVLAAANRGKWPDLLINVLSTIGMSMPTFYIGLWVLTIFASKLGIIPIISNRAGVPHYKTLIGPVITMVLGLTLVRTTRSSMLEIMEEDFIRTAKAKGVSRKNILFRHALENALIPIITMIGYNLASAMAGAIVLETVFVRNGVGKLLIDAITVRDYPMIQGAALVIAALMIMANIITDIVVALTDPRIRVAGEN